MRIVFEFLTFGHVAGVALTSQSSTSPGDVLSSVLEFISGQHAQAEADIKKYTEELELESGGCAKQISNLNKDVLTAQTKIADLQSRLTSETDAAEANAATLENAKADLTTEEHRLKEVENGHAATSSALKTDSGITQNSVRDISALITNAAGSHADGFIRLAKKFKKQLEDRYQNIQTDLAEGHSSHGIEVSMRQNKINGLNNKIAGLTFDQEALIAQIDSIQADLMNEKATSEKSQSDVEQTSQRCQTTLDDLHGLIQDQVDFQQLMGTVKTMLGGNAPSFLQQRVVSGDIGTLKRSIHVLARKYQDNSLVSVASLLNSNEAQWGIIMKEIQSLLGHLSKEIDRKEATLQNFEHHFGSAMQKANDVCHHLDTSHKEMEAAGAAAGVAKEEIKQMTEQLAAEQSAFQDELSRLQQDLMVNNQDVKQFKENAKGFHSTLEVVEQRDLKAELVQAFQDKMADAIQSIQSTISDLQQTNEDLSEEMSSKRQEFDMHSQSAKAEIAEKTAVANDQEHRAEHLASKIHLFKKEQVTLFGHLGNMHASDECINPESSCDNASTACKQSFDDALELSNQELDKLKAEFQGVKDAASTLRNLIEDQN